ncbi:ribonuclease H-like domain-containing protein [Geopyxis carbonaria]|nr:ribonuclease H-like domain-containing protein [Geopyxis carbonaria]
MSIPTTAASLSSNWKVLQKRLQAVQPPATTTTAAKKRKPESDHRDRDRDGVDTKSRLKRARPNDTTTSDGKKTAPPKKPVTRKPAAKAKTMVTPAPASPTNKEVSASMALWAEDNDISPEDLAKAYGLPLTAVKPVPTKVKVKVAEGEDGGDETVLELPGMVDAEGSKTELGKYIAMDCEMVGVGGEGDSERSALARVSIVNFHGHCVLDVFVKPKERVKDWRTWVSGVRPSDMEHALTFEEAQKKVAELMQDRILVGHAIKNDLECLLIGHPRIDTRDTSRFPPFRKLSKGRTPGLKKLAKELLGIDIQGGSHSSIEDARACMLLYRRNKDEFERLHAQAFPQTSATKGKGGSKKSKKKSKRK